VLTRPGNLDELTVQVEHAPTTQPGTRDPEVLGAELADRVKQRIGVTASVEVLAPHSLQRSLGKAKRINDLRSR
jgi:phenylacetate-CoA ligase